MIQHQAGHWGFPKGHPEKGERELEAALRELQEETGLQPDRVWPERRYRETYCCVKKGRQVAKTVVYFAALVSDPDVAIQPAEICAYTWVEVTAAAQRMTFAEGKKLVSEFLEDLPDILQAGEA